MNHPAPSDAGAPALGPDELDELDTLLDDLRTRGEEIPQWEFCDGFLAALACTRRSIAPAEYLPMLLGDGEALEFTGSADFARLAAINDALLSGSLHMAAGGTGLRFCGGYAVALRLQIGTAIRCFERGTDWLKQRKQWFTWTRVWFARQP